MREPPGLQLLHCIKTAGTGGESIFSDALQAASIIENVSPEAMEILSSFPVAYHYTKGGHHFQDSKPVFEMSPYHYKVSLIMYEVCAESGQLTKMSALPRLRNPIYLEH